MTNKNTGPVLSRRGLLASGVAAGVSLAAGLPASPAHAVEFDRHNEIWGQLTYYTPTGQQLGFDYEPNFYNELEVWLGRWYFGTPSNWVTPIQVWSYGAGGNKPGLHGLGRAIDISHLYTADSNTTGGTIVGFTGRYDIWRGYGSTALATARRRYWATVASLNAHFGVVLTYLYNSEHHNHVHVDNSEPKTFNRSTSQVQMVQAACTYIWGYSTGLDGLWGTQTDTNSRKVLNERLGISGGLTTSTSNWVNFCNYSMEKGTGRISL